MVNISIMTFTRTDVLDAVRVGSGIGLVVVGACTCATAARHYDKSKRFWWMDAQLLGCGAITLSIAAATAYFAAKALAKHN